ncbi:MAG: EamA family transporter [Candidatus Aenigmarchaeota archaeon]|nr:EamA family transporter [Candidatus Aenigmarchaeota archaeon]
MLQWVVFALLGYFFFAVGNIVEKIIRVGHIKNSMAFAILLGFYEIVFILLIPFYGLNFVAWPFAIAATFAGVLRIFAFLPYAEALSKEEVSRLVPVWNLIPIFTVLMAFLFLGENLAANFIISFVLIFAGSVLLTMRSKKNLFRPNKAFLLMLISSFVYAAQAIVLKFAYAELNFVHGLIWMSIGTLVTTMFLLSRKNFRIIAKEEILENASKRMIIIFMVFSILGLYFTTLAISIGSVSIVEVMGGFQMVFVFIIASVFAFRLPSMVREKLTLKSISIKIFCIILMLFGLFFLYY